MLDEGSYEMGSLELMRAQNGQERPQEARYAPRC
jgi:hypothetical protein